MNPLDLLMPKPREPQVPVDEVAAQQASNEAAMQREEQSLYDNETIADETALKQKLISPKAVSSQRQVYSRRDILTCNLNDREPNIVYMETDLISLCYYEDDLGGISWGELAKDLGDRFEDWLAAKGAIQSRTFRGVLERNANINRTINSGTGQNPFMPPRP